MPNRLVHGVRIMGFLGNYAIFLPKIRREQNSRKRVEIVQFYRNELCAKCCENVARRRDNRKKKWRNTSKIIYELQKNPKQKERTLKTTNNHPV